MLITFPEVFNTVPTDFTCVEKDQISEITCTLKEITRSYAIVNIHSTAGFNSVNDFNWRAVAYNDGSSKIIYKTISLTSNSSGWYDCTSEIPNGYVCVNVLPITQDYWLSGGVTGALRNVYPDGFAKDVTITARLTCVK